MIRTEEITEKVCANCRFSREVRGLKEAALICENKAESEDICVAVKAENRCINFDDCGHSPSEIATALAEGAKLIPLSQGKFAIVDAEDYERLSKYTWHVINAPRTAYAGRHVKGGVFRMHREILRVADHLFVDHRDHNGLNNRKSNLRACTNRQNTRNRRPVRNTSSKYKGVFWSKWHNKFKACINADGKRYHLGYFKSEIAAAKAYDKKAFELFGEFAYLNFPEDFGLPRRRIGI